MPCAVRKEALDMWRFAACAAFVVAFLVAAFPARAEIALQPGLWQETETGSENNAAGQERNLDPLHDGGRGEAAEQGRGVQ